MESAVLKTVAGFLNTEGGTLLIGVDDDGQVTGIEIDYPTLGKKQDRDGFENWLIGLLRSSIGITGATKVTILFEEIEGKTVCSVKVAPGDSPSYVKSKSKDFYARVGNSTHLLDTEEAVDYTKQRWPSR